MTESSTSRPHPAPTHLLISVLHRYELCSSCMTSHRSQAVVALAIEHHEPTTRARALMGIGVNKCSHGDYDEARARVWKGGRGVSRLTTEARGEVMAPC